jgi:tRNA-splicing ligase RtcB
MIGTKMTLLRDRLKEDDAMSYSHQIKLKNGKLQLYANPSIRSTLSPNVYQIANNQLQIPNQLFFSLTPDVHVNGETCIGTTAVWNLQDGFISPSIVGTDIGCGIRVHVTPLHKKDIADIRIRQKIVRYIEKFIPLTDQIPSHYRSLDLNDIIKNGLYALAPKFLTNRSFTHVEASSFKLNIDYLAEIHPQSWNKAKHQLGTLGSGNHFIELQAVTIPDDKKELAAAWGLFEGQVIFLIHSGSRAWGKSLESHYTQNFAAAMKKRKLSSEKSSLLYLPISSPEAKKYFHLMASAMNYALVNRQLIAFGVENALKQIYGSEMKSTLLYDLMHNYALVEEYQNKQYLVHRKGTTKALPANHQNNPAAYRSTGHPALIPGSMGTPSYIMVGEKEAEKNFYSICHGAGRIFSSHEKTESTNMQEKNNTLSLNEKEFVVLNQWTKERIQEESPSTYKEVDQVIDTIVGAKLASVVAKCKPMAVIKAR